LERKHLDGEQMAERSRMGVREEVEEDKHSRRAEGKRKGDGEISRETDKPNEVETTSVQVGEGSELCLFYLLGDDMAEQIQITAALQQFYTIIVEALDSSH